MDIKNILLIIFIAILFPFIFFYTNTKVTYEKNNFENDTINNNTVNYEVIKYNFKSFEPAINIEKKEDKYFISICLGEKKTGGYEMKIYSVKKENDKLIIEVSAKQNSKIVTQAFSYPSITISTPIIDIKTVEVYIYENKIPLIITKDIK
ncbi:protease complex subunit PrcB family protein [Marinitoga litoralis]|uniref:protease complex subunit PrcB family protein n=1 Tax=Marinitoga litoralis TaxID=570855 RepID=UPI00195F2BE9|nr:protease complex subunit PrcB family protein [Marinitoga litoralis]MBM7560151.1 hypothetical protein [Marinitoga litoralis]